jgi:peptide deformylase
MTIRTIIKFPHPHLRAVAETVTAFDMELQSLANDVLDTMRDAPGIGMTAPHIGVLKRVVVIELNDGQGVRYYINPVVEWASDVLVRNMEGSVSMPGINDEVERPSTVRVRYQDLTGVEQTQEADGLLAVCLQHEIDQLDGIFWLYRLSRLKRDRLVKRFEKQQRTQIA